MTVISPETWADLGKELLRVAQTLDALREQLMVVREIFTSPANDEGNETGNG